MLEPATTLTNILLGGVCYKLGSKLLERAKVRKIRAQKFWGWAFIWLGIAAFVGAWNHGFVDSFYVRTKAWLFVISMICVGICNYFLVQATAVAVFGRVWRARVYFVNFVLIWFYIAALLLTHKFFYVVIYYVLLTTGLIAIYMDERVNKRIRGADFILSGLIISLIGVAIQQSRLMLGTAFDHNAICHTVQVGAMILLYHGGIQHKDIV